MRIVKIGVLVPALLVITLSPLLSAQERGASRGTILAGESRIVTEADCTAAPLVATIAPKEIGEPVRSVTLQAVWIAATETVPAHCRVDGVFAPVDTAPTARPINFRVILPASWNRRAAQMGGGGNNGIIPNLDRRRVRRRRTDAAAARLRHLRQRLGPPVAGVRPPRRAAAPAARSGLGAQRRSDPQPRLHADEEDARRRDGAHRAHVRRAAALQLLHRHVAGRARRPDRGAALSGRLRRRRGQRADRELLVADARARADSHPREAGGQLGDAGQGQRDPRRVHAAVRRARRPGRRHHEQLHGVPRDLRREPRRAQPPSVGGEALPEQRRPEPGGHERERLSDRRPDLDAGVRLLALQVCDAAGQRRPRVRHVGAQHRSSGSGLILPARFRARKAPPPTRRCTRIWACSA